jgi:uncharacterized protein involved in exopolysaccharide biosynthesis
MHSPDPSEVSTSNSPRPIQAVILPAYQDSVLLSEGVAKAIGIVRRRWFAFGIASVLSATACIAASHLLPRVYRAETLLVPAQASGGGGVGSLLGRYGGIAAAMGVDVSSPDAETNEALATIRSRTLIEGFIAEGKLLPVLFPKQQGKSVHDAYGAFVRNQLTVQQDKVSRLVTVAIEWTDREQAAAWANELVVRVNQTMRARAIAMADANLRYWREERGASQLTTLRDAAASMIEAQLQKRMLATTQPDYAFRVIDPAVPPTSSIRPKRVVFAMLGAMLGALACFGYFVRRGSATT